MTSEREAGTSLSFVCTGRQGKARIKLPPHPWPRPWQGYRILLAGLNGHLGWERHWRVSLHNHQEGFSPGSSDLGCLVGWMTCLVCKCQEWRKNHPGCAKAEDRKHHNYSGNSKYSYMTGLQEWRWDQNIYRTLGKIGVGLGRTTYATLRNVGFVLKELVTHWMI